MPSRNPDCTACELYAGATTVCVDGYGTGAAGVMLVGEAPGAMEDKLGLPFVGLSGQLLTRALLRAGLKRNDVRITNAVRCRPPGNRDPEPAEAKACFQYLQQEIDEFQPKVVVALGNQALKALSGKASITKARGKIIEPKKGVELGEARLMGSIHPAYALRRRDQALEDQLADDFAIAARLAGRNIDVGLPPHRQVKLLPGYSEQELRDALALLEGCEWLACDLEWTDVNRKRDEMSWPWTPGAQLLAISFSGQLHGCIQTVSLAWPQAGTELERQYIRVLQLFLPDHCLVFHNAIADGLWLVSKGLPFEPAGDTMAQAFLMDEERPRSLEALATTKVKIAPDYKHTGTVFKERPQDAETWDNLLTRNGADTYATLLLHDRQWDELKSYSEGEPCGLTGPEAQTNIARLYANEVMPLIPVVVRMSTAGTPMELAAMDEAIATQQARLETVTQLLAEETGRDIRQAQLLVNSPLRLKNYLNEKYGLHLTSTNKATLSLLQNSIPFIDLVWEYRNIRNKVLGTYLLPWQELLAGQNDPYADGIGRLHAIIGLWARTGRTTEKAEAGGTLHQAPNLDWLRAIVSAPPGYKLFACDNSMVELRVLAWLAPELNMRELFRQGEDLHKATAAYVSIALKQGLTMDEFWPRRHEFMAQVTGEQRRKAKPVNFGFSFFQQPEGFVGYSRVSYGIPFTLAEATMAHDGFMQMYPGLPPYFERCRQELERGWMVTPLGRYKRHFLALPDAINFKIQSTASELLLLALLAAEREIREKGLDAWLFNEVHDSILGCGSDDDVAEAAAIVKKWMERPPTEWLGLDFRDIPVPLKADLTISERWVKD